jgi:hypothetical protein
MFTSIQSYNNVNSQSLKFQFDTLYDIVQYYIKNPSENIMNGMLSICHVQLTIQKTLYF